ncbi:MAG: hypothetical protein Q7S34_02925 [bacterium]|nr:hypothetical protein [bacterium]
MKNERLTNFARRVYREILSRGRIFLRCNCYIHDVGPYAPCSSMRTDVLSLNNQRFDNWWWEIPVWYRFDYAISNAEGGKFSLKTNSRYLLSVVDSRTSPESLSERLTDRVEDAVDNMFHAMCLPWDDGLMKYGTREVKCSIKFVSGTLLEDISPSHYAILPVLSSAYANLKVEFFMQAEKLATDIPHEHKAHVTESMDSLLRRYSAFVAQAQKEQMKQLFGVG